jgi:dipeptidase
MWYAPRRPCSQAFVPIYSGILSVPERFSLITYKTALNNHFDDIPDYPQYTEHNYRIFATKTNYIDQNYKNRIIPFKERLEKIEKKLLSNQEKFERKTQELFIDKPDLARKKLTDYSLEQVKKIVKKAQK